MDKIVFDTNIILHDPHYINKIANSEIIIPSVVFEEIDKYKNDRELGMAVRIFSRFIDKIHLNNYFNDSNSKIRFVNDVFSDAQLQYLGGVSNDNIIIQTAKWYNAKLLSNDTLVRIKARNIANIEVAGLTSDESNSDLDEYYKGYLEHYLPDELVDTLYDLKFLSIKYLEEINIHPHMFIIIKRFSGKSGSLIAKVNNNCTCIEMVEKIDNVWGIKPENVQQLMGMHLLLDNEIPLVSFIGAAGTGKTLLSMACGLHLTQDYQAYEKLVCTKPIIDMGKELGTLPGDKEEKLGPYVDSYYDALEFLFGDRTRMLDALNGMQDNFEIDALNYIRGRSLPGRYFIVDEAQNLSKHEIKTIITRMGKGSKIVLMGDPNQVDNKFLDSQNNGLIHVVEAFKEQGLGGHVTFEKGLRSDLASVAADIL